MSAPYPSQPRQPFRELPDRPVDPFAPPRYQNPEEAPGAIRPMPRLRPPREASFPGPTPGPGEKWYVDTREGTPTMEIKDAKAPTVRRLAFNGQDVRDALDNGEAPILVGSGILKAPPTALLNKLRQAEQAQYADPLKNPARISMLEEAKGMLAEHEQSETKQDAGGKWINVYGRAIQGKAGQPLPRLHDFERDQYDTVDEAVAAAKRRSDLEPEHEAEPVLAAPYEESMKKKRSTGISTAMEYKPPSMHQQVKMSADHMAHMVMDSHPKVKKLHDEIAKAVESAAMKHLGSGKAKNGSMG